LSPFLIPSLIESESGLISIICSLESISSTPLLVAATGVPAPSASVIVRPNGSLMEGDTKRSEAS